MYSEPTDEGFLAHAVGLALTTLPAGSSCSGALVVRQGAVLGTGVNSALRDSTRRRTPRSPRCVPTGGPPCPGAVGCAAVSSCEPSAIVGCGRRPRSRWGPRAGSRSAG